MENDVISDEVRPDDLVERRIAVHLDVCEAVVTSLVAPHQWLGEVYAGGLEAEGEGAALWELSGHALGLSRAYLSLLRDGYVPTAGVMARALHETLVGLLALVGLDGDAILAHYLADHGIKMESARTAIQRTQRRAEADGLTPGDDLRYLAGRLYSGAGSSGGLTDYAHNARRAVREAVLEAGRFAYGPHPDTHRRASHVAYATLLTVQLVESVTMSLARFDGLTDAREKIGKPLLTRLEVVQSEHPLGQ